MRRENDYSPLQTCAITAEGQHKRSNDKKEHSSSGAALGPAVTKVLSTFRSLTIGNTAFSMKLCFLFTSVYLKLFLSNTCQCSKLKKIIKNF